MEDPNVPRYEDLYEEGDLTNNHIINFIDVFDDGKESFEAIQERGERVFKGLRNPSLLITLWEAHPDVFVKSDENYIEMLQNPTFNLFDYIRYKEWKSKIGCYFTTLEAGYEKESNSTYSEASSPLEKIYSRNVKGPGTLFGRIDPVVFARICNKMYMFCYMMLETRFFQYIARHSERNTDFGYTAKLKWLYNNMSRKLEKEVETYCKMKKLEELIRIFDVLITEFRDYGNIPLAKVIIMILRTKFDCNGKEVMEVLEKHSDLNASKKYTYLVDPSALKRAFITSYEVNVSAINTIYKKIADTRKELLESLTDIQDYNKVTDDDDKQVFGYLNPYEMYDKALFKTYKETLDIKCVREMCEKLN